MKARFIYLLRFYLTTILIFWVAKMVFMLVYRGEHTFGFGDMVDVIRHGLSLDLSTALYFLIVPFLLTAVSFCVRLPRWPFLLYYAIAAVLSSLTFVADTSLYAFWQFKLDASCLQYLETPTDAMASVTTGYIIVRVVLFVIVTLLIYFAYALKERHLPFERTAFAHRKNGIYAILATIIPIPLIVIGTRGGLDESTTNVGQAYFSQNQFLNHSAVNPVFSFLSSVGKSGSGIVSYDYYSEEECRALTDSLFFTKSELTDTLLRTQRPNIVIVMMESCGGQFTKIGGREDITPRLNQLADEGIYFTECYANSWRTDKGTVSILSGYPAFPVTSVMKIPEKSRKLPSIASSLLGKGYHTSFFYGGDINFTNMRSYVMGTGYEHLKWKADFSSEAQRSAQWGVRDELMFSELLTDIHQEKGEPWMKTLLTLSSHEPWDVPTNRLKDPVENAFNYLDECVGAFVDSLRQTPVWDDLLIVILPDHGIRNQEINETTRLYNHIPMIWVGGAIKEPRQIDRLCNQSDLAATLLGQMQIDHTAYRFSRDVMSSLYQHPMAWHTFNNGVSLFDSTGFMAYDFDAEQFVVGEGEEESARRLQLAKALLQLSSHDLILK